MARDFQANVELANTETVRALLREAGLQAPRVLGRALYEEGQIAFRNSQKQVPYRFGILKGSGRLFTPEQRGNTVEVVIGYGGAAKKYAAPVHELNKNYNRGKKWHYLSDPVEARQQGMDRRLARRIAGILGGR